MSTNGDMTRVALIADVPVDIWAVPAWAYTGTPSNPHKTKNQECRGFGEEATDISAAEASKGGCSIDTGITAVKPPAAKQSATKAASASAQELAPRLSMLAHSSTMLTLVKIMNETATLSSYQA